MLPARGGPVQKDENTHCDLHCQSANTDTLESLLWKGQCIERKNGIRKSHHQGQEMGIRCDQGTDQNTYAVLTTGRRK